MELLVAERGTEQDRRTVGTGNVLGSAAYDMDSGEIARARAFVRDFLTDARSLHGMPVSERAMDVAQLVVSELATNVCKYAPGPCLLDLEAGDGLLTITMWDTGSVLPTSRQADPTRTGQHGLEIVLAVCESFEVRREPVGKRVRVEISLLDGPRGDAAGPSGW
ncbi:ATP-binding region ATPase domain protein [Streptomyces sp. CBMAI 2042]|nr:ATP-binding protein [Streptomyces sp. CBMAI 2042]RLV65018.1 ATP-binding region ATPase domain protein [Streptomyces sp. CBMAI 2042]